MSDDQIPHESDPVTDEAEPTGPAQATANDAETPAESEADKAQPAEIQVYDFRRPERVSKDRKRSLDAMYGLLAKSLESWVTGRMRDKTDLELLSLDQLTFGEFVLALPSPGASYIVDVAGSGRQGVIDIGHEFAYFVVDRLLGGTGPHTIPKRPLSPIERMVVRIVAERIAYQLSEVWKDYIRLDLEVTAFESIPEMLQVANREDPVLVARLGVNMGEISSTLLLCLPFASLEKFFSGAVARRPLDAQGSPEELANNRSTIESTVRDAHILVGARLPTFDLPLTVLADLKPGAVLPTGLGPETELELFVAGQRRFRGLPGRLGKKLAVRVVEAVEPEPEDLIPRDRAELTS